MSTTDIAGLLPPTTPHRRSPTSNSEVHGRQEYFEFDSPESFISPQLFAVNPSGNMIYSVKIDMKLTLDPDTQEVVIVVGSRLLCRCSIHTGQSTNYVIDYDISGTELRQSTDLYMLTDNIAVLLTYNPENYHFSQHVLALNDETQRALLTITRTTTLPSLSSALTVGTGLLTEGYILITGYSGPDESDRHVVALLIAADPYKASLLPNKDLTNMCSIRYAGDIPDWESLLQPPWGPSAMPDAYC
ncbi:hypothetical protein OESDEN_04074 [Oesophagostomum dentatum]|uniref:Uncharacterized protein n=1 Tax=Oesophagostomum dentatum TaxID=61180 RepID=A0A0B1TJH2_OESDE|nr:hypothetical protein OESDEN_04074 [Oesophagostomum dentatum]